MSISSVVRALHKSHQQTYHRNLTITDSKETEIPLKFHPSTTMALGNVKGKAHQNRPWRPKGGAHV